MAKKTQKEIDRNIKIHDIKKFNLTKYRDLQKSKKRKNVPEKEYLTQMRDTNNVLELDDLHTFFYSDVGTVRAVDGVSFEIPRGKTLGVVGESGCGKSVTSLSVMRILQEPQGQIASGAIRFNLINKDKAYDLAKTPIKVMEKIRGNNISMIFQEPMTTLNPVFTIGKQLDEVYLYHMGEKKLTKQDMKAMSIANLDMVGIANPERVYSMYPHELSGGMRQRVVIAMALSSNPELIIADEPTTALDVTIQAQILDLLRNLKDRINASIMLITHDLGVVAEMADFVVVMYAGRVVEKGTVRDVFHHPAHPYTIGLMKSRPSALTGDDKLFSIPGSVPNPVELPDHCFFRSRCDKCIAACSGTYPELTKLSDTHYVACYWAKEMMEKGIKIEEVHLKSDFDEALKREATTKEEK